MATTLGTKSDTRLQLDVMEALQWEPSVNAAHIGVSTANGVVTLSGHVPSYVEKFGAEEAAKRVEGVRAVADELDVRLPGLSERTDQEIAMACANALKEHVLVPADKVQVTVTKGWVDLEGEVEWHFQRTAAQNAIRHLTGVKNVSNRVLVKPRVTASDLKTQIEKAFKRTAELDAGTIDIKTSNGNVTLSGTVHSTAERDEATRVAWSAPGVVSVENRIIVR